jgi:hypothetical protein
MFDILEIPGSNDDQETILAEVFIIFFSLSKDMPRYFFKLRCGNIIPHFFQFYTL